MEWEQEFESDARAPAQAPNKIGGLSGAAQPALPPDAIAIVPVRDLVLFPGLILPINVSRERSVAAAQAAVRFERQVGLVLQRDEDAEQPDPEQLHRIGTTANILRYVTVGDGPHIVCQGQQRFRILEFLEGYPFHAARIERIPEQNEQDADIQARLMQLKERASELFALLPQGVPEIASAAQSISSASALADMVVGLIDISIPEKQEFLETIDLRARLDKVLALLAKRIEILRLSREIRQQTNQRMEGRQREFLLREQLKTIQSELGESESSNPDIDPLEQAIAKSGMPEDVAALAKKEVERLRRMPDAAGEYSMLRTYLEWLIELPWQITREDRIDIAEARHILDEDHFGLEKVKRRILEFLAVRKLNPNGKGPILCFVGPPGVGKTSLGQSIARATGAKFVRVSLGGVHDEAEIRGHRRTYIGALPGNILQAVRKAGERNCVMMLDEVDKLGSGVHGDPASALLEVLDPEQNSTFRDNYLAVPFDLSRVLFICTANMLDTTPSALRDRMEVIQLPGYTSEEKRQIARRYLVRRQLEANGLTAQQCEISDSALEAIIRDYTREAGVRNLEREIGSVFRHTAMRIAESTAQHERIDAGDLHAILGPRKFESELALRTSSPGVATGLAWTPVGGDILFIEVSRTPGQGKLILTGQLGEVMRESAQAALTLVKAHAGQLNIPLDIFANSDLHLHVPAGAIPKDGPSAGVAMFIALASLAMNRPVRNDRAMTGEISLRGLVLPVGGIKEKTLAALQAGIKAILLPARNKSALEEIPEETRRGLQFIWIETVDDALREALGEPAMSGMPA